VLNPVKLKGNSLTKKGPAIKEGEEGFSGGEIKNRGNEVEVGR